MIASYEGDKLVELRRFERYGDDDRAVERWNELVGARMKIARRIRCSARSRSRTRACSSRARARQGIRRRADGTVVGVYLLTPSAAARTRTCSRRSRMRVKLTSDEQNESRCSRGIDERASRDYGRGPAQVASFAPVHAARRAPAKRVVAVMPVPVGAPFSNQPFAKSPLTGDVAVVSTSIVLREPVVVS